MGLVWVRNGAAKPVLWCCAGARPFCDVQQKYSLVSEAMLVKFNWLSGLRKC